MAAGKRARRPEPKRRAQPASGRHRAVKPRYGRMAAAGCAAVVTLVAVAGGFGWLPHGGSPSAAAAARQEMHDVAHVEEAGTPTPTATSSTTPSTTSSTVPSGSASAPSARVPERRVPATEDVPAGSGTGRRIVFSQGDQHVWLVRHNGTVLRSYAVSGSVTRNLRPGTYQVYSRSRWAVGVDDSGTMQYFVRFTQGPTGAAIGFHTIPVKDGRPLQTRAQLGTPESHGCIRQATPDAIALWDFAPIGTTVVVVA